jgi:hypothetical protein
VDGQHRLRPLKVSVTRQYAAGILLPSPDERPLQFDQPPIDLVDGVPLPESQIGRHLVVPAAGGVEFATGVAEPVDQCPLNVQMNVFQFDLELESPLLNFSANCFLATPLSLRYLE